MRRWLFLCLVLCLPVTLGACRQVCSTWQKTKACACRTFRSPCQPDACGTVWTTPVYDPSYPCNPLGCAP